MKSIENTGALSKNQTFGKILLSILILSILGVACSRYPAETGGGWYHHLNQPGFAPPYWLPFVMWTLVYILMGCSVGIIWQYAAKSENAQLKSRAKKGLVFFAVHLLFNLFFPIILIGFHKPVIGLIDIVILLVFIVFLIRYFRPINRIASNLLIPYFLWIVYATMLTVAVIVLN